MIAIINKGRPSGFVKEHIRVYDVMINDKRITSFTHSRLDGLAVCLEKAAQAVRKEMAPCLQCIGKCEGHVQQPKESPNA